MPIKIRPVIQRGAMSGWMARRVRDILIQFYCITIVKGAHETVRIGKS